jgi:hypothetical protein
MLKRLLKLIYNIPAIIFFIIMMFIWLPMSIIKHSAYKKQTKEMYESLREKHQHIKIRNVGVVQFWILYSTTMTGIYIFKDTTGIIAQMTKTFKSIEEFGAFNWIIMDEISGKSNEE